MEQKLNERLPFYSLAQATVQSALLNASSFPGIILNTKLPVVRLENRVKKDVVLP